MLVSLWVPFCCMCNFVDIRVYSFVVVQFILASPMVFWIRYAIRVSYHNLPSYKLGH